jgi:hypothetical protein
MPFKKLGKIIFKGKIDPRLIPMDPAPGFEIVVAKIIESAVEVWLSDGRIIITPLFVVSDVESGNSKTEERIRNLGSRSRVGGTGLPLER